MIAIDGVVSKMEIRIWMIYLKQDFISFSYHLNAPEAPYMTVLTKNVIGVIGVICD